MGINTECVTLQKIPMFHDVDAAKLRLFALSGQRLTYKAGDVIFRQGDPPEALYVILEGSVDVMHETPTSRTRLAQIVAGNIFGETGVLCDQKRTVTIEVTSDTLTVLQIDRHTFKEMARDVPQLSFAIAKELARRLEDMNEKLTIKSEA